MAFIEYEGQRFQLPAGEALVGADAACHLRLARTGIAPRHAVLTTGPAPELAVTIRPAAEGLAVEVNGVRLGPLPQPLLHGDKITIAGFDFQFADERKSGSTTYISAVKVDSLTPPPSPAPAGPAKLVGTTGGRIISLTDGREYQVGAALRFGREAGADVVVPGGQVSRRHCEIVASPKGYLLIDASTNGTFVNGERVQNQRLLARSDVIKIADEEFRFYADVPAAAPPPPPPAPPVAAPRAAPVAAAPAPPPAAPAKLQSTGFFESGRRPAVPDAELPPAPRPAAPPPPPPPAAVAPPPAAAAPKPAAAPAAPAASAALRASTGGPLAKFLVRSGQLKGQRLYVKVPIVNIGRADYNDMQIPDDSVSSQHAKLTRREGVWVLTDLGSTNGTLVDGERIAEDTPLAPGAFVRFGDVQLIFEPTDDDADMNAPKATRTISAVKLQDLKGPSGPSR